MCHSINCLSSNLFAKDVSGLDSSATRPTARAEVWSLPIGKFWFTGSGKSNFWTLRKSTLWTLGKCNFWYLGKSKFRLHSQLVFLLLMKFSASEKYIPTKIYLFISPSLNLSAMSDGTRASAVKVHFKKRVFFLLKWKLGCFMKARHFSRVPLSCNLLLQSVPIFISFLENKTVLSILIETKFVKKNPILIYSSTFW